MTELYQATSQGPIRMGLLGSVSAFALLAAVLGPAAASDEEARPTVWIEFGGQLERLDGAQQAFLPPFTQLSPTPSIYSPISPAAVQKPSIYSYGGEGKLSFSPEGSDWVFSVAARYGRSNSKKRSHQQTTGVRKFIVRGAPLYVTNHMFADYKTRSEESHTVLDFTVGKDVGLGVFGREGSSLINAGVRFANFASQSSATIIAQPRLEFHDYTILAKYHISLPNHYNYTAVAQTDRSFRGIGPSLSWDASLPLLGNESSGALTFDWGVNGAVLFGRHKAIGHHTVEALYYSRYKPGAYHVTEAYHHATPHNRSRSVTVPNVGGFLGFSMRYPGAKVSFGYRADLFFNAVDVGIDSTHSADRNFYGPFATVSIGLGG